MKKPLLVAFFCYFIQFSFAQTSLQIGDIFPIENIQKDTSFRDNTIVVFMPSLTYECSYASMLTQAFYYYFIKQLSFEQSSTKPIIKIILVVNEAKKDIQIPDFIANSFQFIYDAQGTYYQQIGIDTFANKDASATLFVLDKQHKICFIDTNYRAQGEHLKPLEHTIKKLNNIAISIANTTPQKAFKIGQKAPNFKLNDSTSLYDLQGSIVLLSFYPAAFSGTLKPYPFIAKDANIVTANVLSFNANHLVAATCASQISSFNIVATSQPYYISTYYYLEQHKFMISESTPSLLEQWEKALDTKGIMYVNDRDYGISKQYFSYNDTTEYNNRVSVIIDENCKIAYIDWEFENGDEVLLQEKMFALSQRSLQLVFIAPTLSMNITTMINNATNASNKKIISIDEYGKIQEIDREAYIRHRNPTFQTSYFSEMRITPLR